MLEGKLRGFYGFFGAPEVVCFTLPSGKLSHFADGKITMVNGKKKHC